MLAPVRTVAPTVTPVSLADVKTQLGVTNGASNDLITTLIGAATSHLDGYSGVLGRALVNQTWYLYLDAFPFSDDRIRLPKAPLSSITSIKYTDTAGTETTWDGAYWDADTTITPGELVKTYGSTWPTATLRPNSPIVIEYVAGYGATATTVPEPLRDAMYLLIGEAYNYREPEVTGTIVAQVRSVHAALANYIVEAV